MDRNTSYNYELNSQSSGTWRIAVKGSAVAGFIILIAALSAETANKKVAMENTVTTTIN